MKSLREERQLPLGGFEPTTEGHAANADLVGSSFSDGRSLLTVAGVSHGNPGHVVVVRERDGHSWTMPGGIVRIILGPAKRRRAA
jgi:hypothetical protein